MKYGSRMVIFRGGGNRGIVPVRGHFEPLSGRRRERTVRRSIRHFAFAVVVASIAMLGSLAGVARADGSSAAHDQYKPKPIVKPSGGQQPFTPPGAQASGPTANQGSTLPFTGLSLLKVVLVGVGLLLLGILLRRSVPRRGP